ncbi:TIGR03086 family metal-binding protein [Brevibacterium daeguense]|uniref:TIGR03086 family metal-binding protein n=1 Tax=Brevibacterium daeguense TaxID=909936 RepID=A0ABP8EJ67_9MICO|nr:TIGR03086 family metal-binding protein [Brevibacterium daeguense]
MIDLTPQATLVSELILGISDDRLGDPTPCEAMPVRLLVAHILGLAVAFRDAAQKIDGPTTSTPPDPAGLALPDDWREQIPLRLTELADAWDNQAAWQGTTQAGGLTMPAGDAGLVALDELVLHGWDLAVATSRPYAVEPAALDAVEQFVSAVPDDPDARAGLFGPVVAVDADASRLDRVLGLAGRDPRWTASRSRRAT